MIKITIELLRHGNWNDRKKIADATIWNDCTGSARRGNYKYKVWKKRETEWKSGEIKEFARKSRSVWRLLYLVLKDIYE